MTLDLTDTGTGRSAAESARPARGRCACPSTAAT